MKKIPFVVLAVLGLSARNSESKFKVEGKISGTDGETLYLEASTLEGIIPSGSARLKGNGTFAFKRVRPVSLEFYRLRVDDKVVNSSIGSTETIQLDAPYADSSTAYTVERSANSAKIEELIPKQMQLQNNVSVLIRNV